MTESIGYLTSAQAAARLGIKTATLYAYVSRGHLPRHRSPDGRTSLFALADVARLERRGGQRRSSPSDVTVSSELTLIDAAQGRLFYRGLDALQASRELHFEDVAGWLWTGRTERTVAWRAGPRTLAAVTKALATLGKKPSIADRLVLTASMLAVVHAMRPMSGIAAASEVMACLVDGLPGPGAPASSRFAAKLSAKLGGSARTIDALDAALCLTCEHGLNHPTLAARLTAASGGDVASAVAAAMQTASAPTRSLAHIERAFIVANDEGPGRAAAILDLEAIRPTGTKEPYRSGDPRATVLLAMLGEVTADHSATIDALTYELRKRGAGPPTASYALAALAWSSGMSPGSATAISLIARSAGWIAHALEEHRRPTPFRPRLAYTGQPPRASTPRRTLDAVRDYLSRE